MGSKHVRSSSASKKWSRKKRPNFLRRKIQQPKGQPCMVKMKTLCTEKLFGSGREWAVLVALLRLYFCCCHICGSARVYRDQPGESANSSTRWRSCAQAGFCIHAPGPAASCAAHGALQKK